MTLNHYPSPYYIHWHIEGHTFQMVDGMVDTKNKNVSDDLKITSCIGERNDTDGCFNHLNKFKTQKFKDFKYATVKTTDKHWCFLIYKL